MPKAQPLESEPRPLRPPLPSAATSPSLCSRAELLPLPPETLARLGLVSVEVRDGLCDEFLLPILDDLHTERCVHSWRRFALAGASPGAVADLIAWELSRRPTVMFAYVGRCARGDEQVLGVGTVSERVSPSFPFEGWPVVARCYIRGRYRGQRLYNAVLLHRHRYCQRRWGEALRATHLGSATPWVQRVVTNPAVVQPPFRPVCVEALPVGDGVEQVVDYLSFEEDTASELLDLCDPAQARSRRLAEGLERLQTAIHSLLDGTADTDLFQVREIVRALRGELGWTSDSTSEVLEGLLAFADAISPGPPPTPGERAKP